MVVEVKINGLAVDAQAKSHVVLLKELEGDRVLPIWIGPAEAQAIARELAGQRFPRPLTHDLLATIVEGLKAKVTRVVIAELKDNTFFANLIIERDGEVLSIDARPSDSIAVALRCQAPLFVNDKLLSDPGEQEEPTDEDKAKELRRFLENLDPEDFGKYNP
ncbi:MAG: bifunctional nuclease family protein [Candidatus Eiseniibacteriota bacterium]